jgi:hypothetical protein
MIYIFLSHDVDWGRSGPPVSHVLARRERFDERILKNCNSVNLYYNFPEYIEIEEKSQVRSTFFFRTYVEGSEGSPPAYHVEEYKEEIKSLLRGGWEVGLHLDPVSYRSVKRIQAEKKALEDVSGVPIWANRVHYTLNNRTLHRNLEKLSFKYDSFAKFCRAGIDEQDFGYFKRGNLVVFPITLMDALAFAHMAPSENDVLPLIRNAVNKCREMPREKRIMSIIWHDCVLKMKKGRLFPEILKYLISLKDVEVRRGIDLFEMIEKGMLQ